MKTAWLILGALIGYMIWAINPWIIIAGTVVRLCVIGMKQIGLFSFK